MPGIVGIITKQPREWAERQLLRMVETLRHESFYVTGTWVDESLGVYVGWIARKNSFSDCMPLRNKTGEVTLVFSGEEFAEPETIHRFSKNGNGNGNGNGVGTGGQRASYLVHSYEENPSFPANLNGRFHGLLVDKRKGTATLFNDRYGMQRVYCHEAKDAFYFSAEAKAILTVRPELRTIDPRSMGELVSCGCVLDNRTLFKGIQVLPAASAVVFRNGAMESNTRYFDPKEWEEQSTLEPEAYYQELREVFSRTLSRYFSGPERVGMSLTGGLDTRMIMAWQKPAPGGLPCYSFGGSYRDCQDVVMARRVASACGQPHEVIPVGKEFLSQFPHYAERTVYLTDGCVEPSHSPDLYVNERAAKIAPVRMTGNYGGEVLRRVRAFKAVDPPAGLFSADFLPHITAAKGAYSALTECHPLSFAVFRQAPWHHFGLLSLEQTQLSLRSPYLDNEFVRTVFRAPASALTNNDVSLRLIADGDMKLRKIRTDIGLAGNDTAMSAAMLQKLLVFSFKAEYAYDYGMPQWVAKVDHMFSPLHLERLFLGRHKFYHFRVWYRDALSKYVQEMLLDSRTLSRPYFERQEMERIVRSHVKGDGNFTVAIHKALTLEHVHRLFIDAN